MRLLALAALAHGAGSEGPSPLDPSKYDWDSIREAQRRHIELDSVMLELDERWQAMFPGVQFDHAALNFRGLGALPLGFRLRRAFRVFFGGLFECWEGFAIKNGPSGNPREDPKMSCAYRDSRG